MRDNLHLGIYSEMPGCRPVLVSDLTSVVSDQLSKTFAAAKPASRDILVVDQELPGMTGLEFIQQIQVQGCGIPNSRKAVLPGSLSNAEFRRAKNSAVTCCRSR